MIYKKSGSYNSLDEYIQAITGKTIRGLNRFKTSYQIKNLEKVAYRINKAVMDRQNIFVYGDYDTDGITSVSEMGILLNAKGARFQVYCPRRFSDGYGININTIKMVPDGALLITVDNGIAALDALREAAKRNIEVIILDHHMAVKVDETHIALPKASIIVDPEALPDGCDWDGYCGAGLVCELAKIMLTPGSIPLEHIKALAAIGTVADVVPLLSANRKIVKEGLDNLNSGIMPMGLKALVEKIAITSNICGPLNSEHLGYYISPCCNAAGRMVDNGAIGVVATILADNLKTANNYSTQLLNWNRERKSITQDAVSTVELDENDQVNFVTGTIPAGCLGLVASKLVEMNGRPSFVMAKDKNGIYKGSARSNSPLNNIKHMLDECSDYMLGYGGHAEAAGFSFHESNFEKIHSILSACHLEEIDITPTYDLDILPEHVPAMMTDLDSVGIFGKGCEKPLFRMKVNMVPDDIVTMKDVHLRFKLPGNITGVYFNSAERYKNDGCPTSLYLYGYLQWNYFKNTQSPQLLIQDYEVA